MFSTLAIILALTLNSSTNCEVNVEVRQNNRLVTKQIVTGYSRSNKVFNLVSNEPLTFYISPRNCSFRPYTITTPVLQNDKVSFDIGENQGTAVVKN